VIPLCWRCRARPAARFRLRPWRRGSLCPACRADIEQTLTAALIFVILIGGRGLGACARIAGLMAGPALLFALMLWLLMGMPL
jgi:hypothetical protein